MKIVISTIMMLALVNSQVIVLEPNEVSQAFKTTNKTGGI